MAAAKNAQVPSVLPLSISVYAIPHLELALKKVTTPICAHEHYPTISSAARSTCGARTVLLQSCEDAHTALLLSA
jgi:hypothetical protein